MARALLYCKNCDQVIGEVDHHLVPETLKCPYCHAEGPVHWRKNWDGRKETAGYFIVACSKKGKAAELLGLLGKA